MPLIELKNISKEFENGEIKTLALDRVSFSIKKGEFVAIMGPSGSGKSTLLHIAGLLDDASSGEYFLEDKNIKNYSKEEVAHLRNKKMGFVFQSFNLLNRSTVLENVKLPLLYSDVKESLWNDKAKKAIAKVGLTQRENYEASKLSGGEKQRVAIARALVNDPSIIFADEPTGNLDSKSGGAVMDILENLQNTGRTIILITHETYTAEFAERIIKIKDGKIESDSTVVNRRINGKKDFIK